ncbi:ATP-binding cassette domain-containing protein [Roseiconus lacunae]|uniref:ABC transporter domain-containing protein n=1 Tax=Roseiconus lacunae TaxID=2605694 RepID=A0ABT7PGX5_9BACT|nr:hypothetical protein [Roseiconus lacunae]MCD0458762.1 hypothetical protein [Roseiconus lacunae]MDM4015742.1 hypothetical protein [Roseiconus lacunae]WRQ52347.1 hypothetical protein U8335_07330 [Stieleria sp. HD01]
MNRFSAEIYPGDFVQVPLRQHHDPRDIVSAMLGLYPPESGEICFLGQPWSTSDYKRQFLMRSQIGRVFAGTGWIKSLTVWDNVLLAMRHHGVPESFARQQVRQWSERLSGPRAGAVRQAMRNRPGFVEPSILQVCQWIRAVSNHPKLLILERPLHYVIEGLHEEIVSVIDEFRSAGAAILVFSEPDRQEDYRFVRSVRRWTIVGKTILRDEETA